MKIDLPKRYKRGSDGWWTAMVLYEAANRYRWQHHLPKQASVEIDQAALDAVAEEWNRKPLRRLWLLMTNGDVTQLDSGKEIKLKY